MQLILLPVSPRKSSGHQTTEPSQQLPWQRTSAQGNPSPAVSEASFSHQDSPGTNGGIEQHASAPTFTLISNILTGNFMALCILFVLHFHPRAPNTFEQKQLTPKRVSPLPAGSKLTANSTKGSESAFSIPYVPHSFQLIT